MAQFSDLTGKTLTALIGAEIGSDVIGFGCSDGSAYRMYHQNDCCESVSVDDIVGDISDLLDSPIISADESTNSGTPKGGEDSWTWTFYRISTDRGTVVIKWYGSSNGYYSESVYFDLIQSPSL